MKSEILGRKIIEALTKSTKEKLNYKQIAAKVGIYDRQGREQVKALINEFVDAHIVIHAGRGKYKINPKYLTQKTTNKNFMVGRVQINRSGTAFVISENDLAEDVFVAEANLSNALHNDLVKVLVFPARNKRSPEGEVVEVIERSKKQLVGTIQISKGIAYFIPDNPVYRRDILIPGRMLNGAKSGEKVVVVITDWVAGTRSPLGEVRFVLGKPGENNVEMNAILAENDFPLAFPETVLNECADINPNIPEKEIRSRRDFRNVTTFTIDPADAKDFDDAISYEKLENGLHRVGVHIADVSYYASA